MVGANNMWVLLDVCYIKYNCGWSMECGKVLVKFVNLDTELCYCYMNAEVNLCFNIL